MNTEVLFTDLLVKNMTGSQYVSSACLLLHCLKAILILVKYSNLILTGDLNLLVLEEVKRAFSCSLNVSHKGVMFMMIFDRQ